MTASDASPPSRAPAPRELTDPDRLASLRATGLLDSPPEAAFDRLTSLAARLLEAPVALVSLVTDERQFFKSCVGLGPVLTERRETPLSHSFCQYVTSGEPLVVEDAREHPLVADNLAIEDFGVVAYAGFPIRDFDGHVLGSFCVTDEKPRRWSGDELRNLEDLAASVSTEVQLRLALARAKERAAEAEETTACLRRAEAELRRSLQARDEISAIVSHDLRNPLNAVALAAELLRETEDADDRRRHVDKIHGAVERMARLIRDLVDITRVESGTLAVDLAPVAAADLLGRAQSELADVAAAAGVELVCLPAEPPDLAVAADRHRVLQVLSNLLANAVRHSPEGSRVELGARNGGGEAVLWVEDQGSGLPEEDLEHVFDRFWRGRRRRGDGAGLGLAIARGIVEAHGGRIEAESCVGCGATFRFTLPLATGGG
jgi:signal transduction histidine kinase